MKRRIFTTLFLVMAALAVKAQSDVEPSATPAADTTLSHATYATYAASDEPVLQPVDDNLRQEVRKQRFLPTRRRMDREIGRIKYAYKGEVMLGLTASYGTLTSEEADVLTLLSDITADGSVASVRPYVGYFYRDNRCIGLRLGYQYINGKIQSASYDLGPSNDASGDIPYLDLKSNTFSVGVFHRTYAGLDDMGRFGLFAEFELALNSGSSNFAHDDPANRTYASNTRIKLAFNPGAAVYIFPNVCATISFGLGGIQYNTVTQKNVEGEKIGSRKTSQMRFRLNLAAINFGMNIHLWDKKKK